MAASPADAAPPPPVAGKGEGGGGRPRRVLPPYLAVLAALIAGSAWFARTGQATGFVTYAGSALILLIVGRQLLILRENRDLTRDLETLVAHRTAELCASEQRFHSLVQHSTDVVTVVGTDAVVLYQSESVQRVFGYTPAMLTGRDLTERFSPESAARLLDALRSVSARPYATTVLELTLPHLDQR